MEGKSLTWSPNRAKFSSPSSSRDYGLCRLSPRDPSLTRLINRSIPFEIRFSIEIRRKEERNEFSSFFFHRARCFLYSPLFRIENRALKFGWKKRERINGFSRKIAELAEAR